MNKQVFLAGILCATSVFAADPILGFRSNNGPVAPKFAKEFQCDIYADHVYKNIVGKSIKSNPKFTKVSWTNEVKNSTAAKKLVIDSEGGPFVRSRLMPVGSGTEKYMGMIPARGTEKAAIILLHKQTKAEKSGKPMMIETNQSQAAQKLVNFINYNCKMQ